jgi:hypothetical protein
MDSLRSSMWSCITPQVTTSSQAHNAANTVPYRLKLAKQTFEQMLRTSPISCPPHKQEKSHFITDGTSEEAKGAAEQADGRLVAGW